MTLGIETSCDETSVAVVEDGRKTLSNVIHSQVQLHAGFGGVVPELAARDHLERLPGLLELALERAGARPSDIELIAATRGPGLAGCLLVGTGIAEGLSAAWSVPLTGVNHLWGHIYSAMLAVPDLEPPLLGLVVSGAHSDLVRMPEHGRFEVIGRTRDDAAGEAFDKAARMLGLGYPGGPALDRLARTGDRPARAHARRYADQRVRDRRRVEARLARRPRLGRVPRQLAGHDGVGTCATERRGYVRRRGR